MSIIRVPFGDYLERGMDRALPPTASSFPAPRSPGRGAPPSDPHPAAMHGEGVGHVPAPEPCGAVLPLGVGLPGRDALPAGEDGANHASPRPIPSGIHVLSLTSARGVPYVGYVVLGGQHVRPESGRVLDRLLDLVWGAR